MSAPALAVDFYWEGGDDFVSDHNLWGPDYGRSPGTADNVANTTDNVFHQYGPNSILNINTNWSVNQILAGYVSTGESDQGTATIKQIDGNVFVNSYLRLGDLAGSSATYTISGGTLTLRSAATDGPLQVGYNGTGTLNINGGLIDVGYGYGATNAATGIKQTQIDENARNTSHSVYIGAADAATPAGQKGIVNQSAGTLQAGSVYIGVNGGTGEYTMTGGEIKTSSWMVVGGYGNSDGKLVMSGDARVAVGWDWLVYGGNLARHWDLKDPADYPDITDTNDHKNGATTIPPNGTTRNGTYFIIGGVVRDLGDGSNGGPTGAVEMSGNSQLLIQGEVQIGLGERRTADATNANGGGTGTLTLTENAYFATLGNGFYLGRKAGHGTLNIHDNAQFYVANNAWIGGSTPGDRKVPGAGDQRNGLIAATGIINQTGGYAEFRGDIKMGEGTNNESVVAKGTINLSGGEFVVGQMGMTEGMAGGSDSPNIGRIFLGLYGTGDLNVSGTGVFRFARTEVTWAENNQVDAYFVLGNSKNMSTTDEYKNQGLGTVTQTGGVVDASGIVTAIGRSGGNGVYNMNGGVANLREVFLGFHKWNGETSYSDASMTGSTGTLNLRGGVMTVKYISQQTVDNTKATGIINFDGGTLKASDTAAGIWITDQIDELNVLAGGGVIDTNGRTVEIAAPLSGAGALEVIGGGALTFTGDNSNYTGAISITSGSGVIAANAVLAIVLDGAAAGIESGTADADNPLSVTGGGAITIADGATLNVVLRNAGALAEGTYVYNVFVGNVSYDKDQVNLVTGVAGGYSYTLNGNGTLTVQVVPEPGTYALLGGVGLLGLVALRRRKTKA